MPSRFKPAPDSKPEPAHAAARGPHAFRILILKLTAFCNLNCSYCYMFNSLDQSHARKPRHMSPEIALRSLDAMEAHLARAGVTSSALTLHGGEPTLWPLASFRLLCDGIARMRARGFTLDIAMQTNLWQRPKRELLELCREHEVGLGVSLDGPRAANDANRIDFAGHGTYEKILGNVRWIIDSGYRDVLGGFLCVMQPGIDPEAFLAWVAALPVPRVDLLWPIEFNPAHTPWARGESRRYAAAPLYGEWVTRVFEAWWRLDRPDVEVRLFANAVASELGGVRASDMLGERSFDTVVVNTDGAIEMADYFRTAKDGGSVTGYFIHTDEFDDLTHDARFLRLRRAAETSPAACRPCPHLRVCRGGTLSGRLDANGEVSAKRSVLCADHKRFFDTVKARVAAERL